MLEGDDEVSLANPKGKTIPGRVDAKSQGQRRREPGESEKGRRSVRPELGGNG